MALRQLIIDIFKDTNIINISALYYFFSVVTGITGMIFIFLYYNWIITVHFITIIFILGIVSILGMLANKCVVKTGKIPVLISDMVFPRLNHISFWLLPPSLILLLVSLISILRGYIGIGLDLAIFSLHLADISSIFTAINFITTIVKLFNFNNWRIIFAIPEQVVVNTFVNIIITGVVCGLVIIIGAIMAPFGLIKGHIYPIIAFFYYCPIDTIWIVSIITIIKICSKHYPNNKLFESAIIGSFLVINIIGTLVANPIFFTSIYFPISIIVCLGIYRIIIKWKSPRYVIKYVVILALIVIIILTWSIPFVYLLNKLPPFFFTFSRKYCFFFIFIFIFSKKKLE